MISPDRVAPSASCSATVSFPLPLPPAARNALPLLRAIAQDSPAQNEGERAALSPSRGDASVSAHSKPILVHAPETPLRVHETLSTTIPETQPALTEYVGALRETLQETYFQLDAAGKVIGRTSPWRCRRSSTRSRRKRRMLRRHGRGHERRNA